MAIKKILVPTDFSENAYNALTYAISIAKKEKAKIILLHVFSINYISSEVPIEYFAEELASTGNEAAKKLRGLCNEVEKDGKLKCETINRQGQVVDIILDTITKKNIDMTIMGTKGASGLKEILIGSNTAKIITKASCPVIAVPGKASFHGIKKIVYATDYHLSDIVNLKQLADMAKVFHAQLNIVHISNEHKSKEVKHMDKFLKKVRQKIHYKNISHKLLKGLDVEKKLQQYLKKESANLLATSTRYRGIIERLFGKSITKKIAYHTKVPLIAFHYKQDSVVFI